MPGEIDYGAWRFWLDISQLIGIVLIGIYSWWGNRERVTNKRFNAHDKRLTSLEIEIKKLPPDLSTKFEQLHGDMREMKGSLNGIKRAVDLMNEYLISRGGK